MNKKTLLSFVIPCYRSEKTISKVIDEIIETVAQRDHYDYEIIAVNDCSPDNVWGTLKEIAAKNRKVKIVNLVKNMGKHAAVLAGYSFVKGEYVVNLDDDYQSPVNNLWMLLDPLVEGGYDVSVAKYSRKKESAWKRIGSNINLFTSEIMLKKPKGMRFENFSIIRKNIVDEIIKYKNPYPFLEGLVLRVTQNIVSVPMEQRGRGDDNSTGFTFRKSLSLFANGFTNFSVKPLRFATFGGAMFALAGFLYGIYIIVSKIQNPEAPLGWSSMMAVILFSSGMIMIMLGIIGEYVGRIFICINNAPQYVVKETINIEETVE